MELSEIQETLLGGLQLLSLQKDNIIMIMLMLQSSEQQIEMLQWMAYNIEMGISQEQIMDKAQEIMLTIK